MALLEAFSLLSTSSRSQKATKDAGLYCLCFRADLRKKSLLNSSPGLNVIPNKSNLQPHLNWGIEGESKGVSVTDSIVGIND